MHASSSRRAGTACNAVASPLIVAAADCSALIFVSLSTICDDPSRAQMSQPKYWATARKQKSRYVCNFCHTRRYIAHFGALGRLMHPMAIFITITGAHGHFRYTLVLPYVNIFLRSTELARMMENDQL